MVETSKKTGLKKKFRSVWLIPLSGICVVVLVRFLLLDWTWVKGESMTPTLMENELILVEKVSKISENIQRGEIWIITYPSGEQCVKRIIGLGNDSIAILNNQVVVNGMVLNEDYLKNQILEDMNEYIVPENHVFFLGDNRGDSLDSRNLGIRSVTISQLVGRVVCVLYPFDRVKWI